MSTENEYLFYKITKSKLWYSFKQSYVKKSISIHDLLHDD